VLPLHALASEILSIVNRTQSSVRAIREPVA
jgi:hypothetical protein